MQNFILKNKPYSYNSWDAAKKAKYKKSIVASFEKYNLVPTILSGELYATIYYFFNENKRLDADNISKPLLDCLSGFLYNDDQQIKIRIAGSFNLTTGDYNLIDLSGLQGNLLTDLLEAFENEAHIIYVECGIFNPSMYKFNIE
jgi:Holliday junction resolvase RusA-like endonuclease